jgi:hypothetical protein
MPPVSMSEERFPGELLESRPSSARVALGAAGVIIGLAALVCGGVAGYVALTTTGPVVVDMPPPPAEDPPSVRAIADKIIAIDIPSGFEPLHSSSNMYMYVAEFGRKDSNSVSLTVGRADLSVLPATEPEEAQSKLLSQMDRGRPHATASMTVVANSPQSKTVFTVLRQQVPFQFVDGTLPDSGTLVRRASGTFRTRKAYIALIYTVPAAEFDEEAFSKMLESIRPAAGDSMPDGDAADNSEGPQGTGAQAPTAESSEPAKPGDSR